MHSHQDTIFRKISYNLSELKYLKKTETITQLNYYLCLFIHENNQEGVDLIFYHPQFDLTLFKTVIYTVKNGDLLALKWLREWTKCSLEEPCSLGITPLLH